MRNALHLILLLLLFTNHVNAQETPESAHIDTTSLRLSKEIFLFVDSMAMPVGGYEPFYMYIATNLRYPEEAREKRITGKVIVEFVVEKDGKISSENIRILKSPHVSLSEEALRLMENASDWKPGKIKGIPVRSKKMLPLSFKLG
jgi:periplasmic protein TonB